MGFRKFNWTVERNLVDELVERPLYETNLNPKIKFVGLEFDFLNS